MGLLISTSTNDGVTPGAGVEVGVRLSAEPAGVVVARGGVVAVGEGFPLLQAAAIMATAMTLRVAIQGMDRWRFIRVSCR